MMAEKPILPMPTPIAIPTPQPHRRPRVREVSSRFMSSLTTSSSSSTLCDTSSAASRCTPSKPPVAMTPNPKEVGSRTQQERSRSVHRERNRGDSGSDEGNVRRSDTSIGARHEGNAREVSSRFLSSCNVSSSYCGEIHVGTARPVAVTPMPPKESQWRAAQQARLRSVQRQQQDGEGDENRPESNVRRSDSAIGNQVKPRSAVKLFKESGDGKEERQRVDTPVPCAADLKHRRAYSSGMDDCAAAKALQYNGTPFSSRGFSQGGNKVSIRARSPKAKEAANRNAASGEFVGEGSHEERGVSLVISGPNSHLQKSATPDGRSWKSNYSESLKGSTSSCARSLDFPFTRQEQSLFQAVGPDQKSASFSFKSSSDFGKPGSACLPPVPRVSKLAMDMKRKKEETKKEETHQHRLLYNRYLQWRYANARAEASMMVQKRESEKLLYSVGPRICELRESVKMKRAELESLRRMKTLAAILEAQMSYLDEWSDIEGDNSSSLTGTIEALLNASSHLPTDGNVKHNEQEMAELLSSAIDTLETTFQQAQNFVKQAEQVNSSISELARVFLGERALVDECGELLQSAYKSQIDECSLRGLLMQVHQSRVVHTKTMEDHHHDIGK